MKKPYHNNLHWIKHMYVFETSTTQKIVNVQKFPKMVGIMSSSATSSICWWWRNLSASITWCWSQGWRALTYSLTSRFACACAWSCSIICRFLWWANVLLVFIITVNHFSESQPLLCKLIIKLFLLQEFVVYCVRLPTHFLSVLVLRWWGAGLCFWHPLRCPHKPPLDKRGADYTLIFSHITLWCYLLINHQETITSVNSSIPRLLHEEL